tara:strand:+ start:667 stop:939 length:273 start_codon:yes stop_codon:yes gene_type:complete
MEFTVYVETEDPRFTDRTFQLRDEDGDVWDAFATKEDLVEGAREIQRDAQSRANEAQEEVDGLEKVIQTVLSEALYKQIMARRWTSDTLR